MLANCLDCLLACFLFLTLLNLHLSHQGIGALERYEFRVGDKPPKLQKLTELTKNYMYFGSFGDQMFQLYQIQLVIHRNLRKIDCSLKLVTSTSQYLYVISVPFKNSVWDGEWTKGNKFPKLENYIRLLLFPVGDKTFSVCVALKTWDKQKRSATPVIAVTTHIS